MQNSVNLIISLSVCGFQFLRYDFYFVCVLNRLVYVDNLCLCLCLCNLCVFTICVGACGVLVLVCMQFVGGLKDNRR